VSQLARQKRIDIRVEVEPSLEVDVDGKLIEQALINLVDNAVKYTNEGGTAKISARPVEANGPPTKVAVEVSDTGTGIPAEDLVRVFERFYRVDKGRSRAQGGTGLGLSIVRHIVESHGEKVYVDSELGGGTTFGFTLPVASA
jgi:two-component system phosphate regulon sensor histidine kinase PhoR